jgi:enolase
MVRGAGRNKKDWGGNATLAASTTLFQALMNASGFKAWQMFTPAGGLKTFTFPNIGFNMVCGGEHVPGTRQDIQEMFFFAMAETSIMNVFRRATDFFKQFEKNLVRDGLPTGTAKERGFVFPVADNYEGLKRIQEVARQMKLATHQFAIGTDNAFSELQQEAALREAGRYNMRFSGSGEKSIEELIAFNKSIIDSAPNFATMEDPAAEHDVAGHKLMNALHGDRVQVVIDDAAVTQLRFIIPFLAGRDRAQRAGSSVLIKLNQAGTFTETRLATEVVLGLANPSLVASFLNARDEMDEVLTALRGVGVNSLDEALSNIADGGFTAFFSHRSTEGSSIFLPYMPLMYGAVSNRIWFKAGAPNGERNLQNYNPLIRAEGEMRAAGIQTQVANWGGLPQGVIIPGITDRRGG